MKEGTSQDASIWKILPDVPCMFSSINVLGDSVLVFGGYQTTSPPEKSSSVYVYDGSQHWKNIDKIPADAVCKVSDVEIIVMHEEKVIKIQIKGQLHV